MHDPLVEKYQAYDFFISLDFYFAKMVAPQGSSEELLFFLAYLFAITREGHLCLQVKDGKVFPLLMDSEKIQEKILSGERELTANVVEDVTSDILYPDKMVCRFCDHYYLNKSWFFETLLDRSLKKKISQNFSFPINREKFKQELNTLTKEKKISIAQEKILHQCLERQIQFILGGPGTGKSYIASLFAMLCEKCAHKKDFTVAFLAPTGKALYNLEKKLSLPVFCHTIHSYLDLSPNKIREIGKKAYPYDLILVDEASMIDVRIMAYLLDAVPEETKLIFLGDPHQLPPVEFGSVLSDIAKLYPFVCHQLTRPYRFEEKEILELAHSIRNRSAQDLLIDRKKSFICAQEEEIKKLIIQSIPKFVWHFSEKPTKEKLFAHAQDIIFLSTVRGGFFGVDFLNKWIFNQVMQQIPTKAFRAFPIMVTKNDKKLKLYNGMQGVLVSSSNHIKSKDLIYFEELEKPIPCGRIAFYSMSYVISVHKSQGSEYNEVILLLPKSTSYFGNEIIYTGVTRAKKKLIIIGDDQTIKTTLNRSMKRESGLALRRSI